VGPTRNIMNSVLNRITSRKKSCLLTEHGRHVDGRIGVIIAWGGMERRIVGALGNQEDESVGECNCVASLL